MTTPDRQRVIEINRSLRIIRNELESLLEKGVINDPDFDRIQSFLPGELSISKPGISANSGPIIDTITTPAGPSPPSYSQTTGAPVPAKNEPELPTRPSPPILGYAQALFKYNPSDARDVALQPGDRIIILEHMNDQWWMGRNMRTQQEGIFPHIYVKLEEDQNIGNEKAGGGNPGYISPPLPPSQQPSYGASGYPPPPGHVNPYNAHVPPMAVAQQGADNGPGGGKMGEHGKKFGKKLGNAAIFGAGATIGSNIVNSIF